MPRCAICFAWGYVLRISCVNFSRNSAAEVFEAVIEMSVLLPAADMCVNGSFAPRAAVRLPRIRRGLLVTWHARPQLRCE